MEFNNDKNNRDMNETNENGFHLFPVSAHASGEGLPYAPVDWPQPGDTWRWKVGNRVAASGFFLDRYLYLPKRLQIKSKRRTFASKLSVEQHLVCTFPDADVEAFFASFSWKVPSLNPSEIKGTEQSGLETRPATPTKRCKAGNKFCASLVKSEERISRAMFCDICCSEHGFCRDCCCILCCKTINTADGGYSFIVCEAAVDEGGICEHIAHIECGLKCCLAGTIGESGLDAEYYCRRCDARTDLISHVTKLLQSCESIDSRDEIEKILNLGALILRGSQRTSAKRLLRQFELAKAKLECKTCLKKVLRMEDRSPFTPVVHCHGDASECTINERLDIRPGSAQKVSEIFNPMIESLKLELQVDQAMLGLRKSQESEYSIAQQKLYAQARCLQNLYRQLEREKGELALHMANGGDTDALHQRVKTTENHIRKEKIKLKEMQLVGNGFGATPEEVMKEHFGLGVSLSHG